MRNFKYFHADKQNGTILIVALFIVALVSALATGMALRLHNSIQFNEALLNEQKAKIVSDAAVVWAANQLKGNPHTPDVVWNKPLKFTLQTSDGIPITAELEDAQAYFNINSLNQVNAVPIFAALLRQVHTQFTKNQAFDIAQKVAALINYKALSTLNTTTIWLWRINQLLDIKDINMALLNKLKPFLVALPESTTINVMTAPPVVLQSLSPRLTPFQVEQIIKQREQTNGAEITSLTDWVNKNQLQKVNLPLGLLTLKTHYFHLAIKMELLNQWFQRDVYFKRVQPKSNVIFVQTIKDQIRQIELKN